MGGIGQQEMGILRFQFIPTAADVFSAKIYKARDLEDHGIPLLKFRDIETKA